jgi:hypothetical protein
MSKITNPPNHGDYEARYRKALERLGTNTPKCAHCGVTNPFCLQLHHIAGQANDSCTIILCHNHHAMITNAQKDHPLPVDDLSHPANRLGNIVLGIAELLLIAVEMLREAGRYLIEIARAASQKSAEVVS